MNDYRLNLVSKGVSSVSGLITSVIIARYLGVVLRGELAYIMQAAGLLAILLGLGLNQAFPYFFRANPSRTTFDLFIRLFLIQFVAYTAAALALAVLVGDASSRYLALLVVVTLLYQQMESVMAVYDIRLKIWTNIGVSLLRVIANLAMLLWFPMNLLWPVAIYSGMWLVAVGVYLVGTGGISTGRVELGQAKAIVAYSWLPMFSTLLVVMNYNADTLMLKWLGDPRDLGYYSVAVGIVIYLWVIPDAVKEVLVSRVARSPDVRLILLPLKTAVLLGLVSVLLVVAVGPVAIPLLFGDEFAPAYGLCVILSLGVLSMIYYKILGVVMLAEGRSVFYFTTLALAVVVNCAANVVAIPAFGAQGAAWATVASYAVTGGTFAVYFCRIKGLGLSDIVVISRQDLQSIWSRVGRSAP